MRKFKDEALDRISFPMGGIGAGTVCFQGTGSLGSVAIENTPNMKGNPNMFSALTVKGEKNISRVIEAPVPKSRYFNLNEEDSSMGLWGKNYGFPRFKKGEFTSQFPFASLSLSDPDMPVLAEITGWSPFIPNDEDNSSLPFAALEYTFTNISDEDLNMVYYFNSVDFICGDDPSKIKTVENGFAFERDGSTLSPHRQTAFCAAVDYEAFVNTAWFVGEWFDAISMLWNDIEKGTCKNNSGKDPLATCHGATIAVPFSLARGKKKTISLRFSWYTPKTNLNEGYEENEEKENHVPWYSTVLKDIDDANEVWRKNYTKLREETKKFTDCFYDTSLPDTFIEAVSANLSILKSPTVLRQADGRLWGWEGCSENVGSCYGSCTHVWNYAQAICHLFPRLERSLRESEFFEAQDDETGHQAFRSYLPIRKTRHDFFAASDGQLGGIIKLYRDWRISGDNEWLKKMWPQAVKSLDYCINQWDPEHEGIIKKPHHNTYDNEFWGPDGMSMSFYLGALIAAREMGKSTGENCSEYERLYELGKNYLENDLYNGEYFYHKILWDESDPELNNKRLILSEDTKALIKKEGPKYQCGNGCLSDGVVGIWLSELCGLNDIIDDEKLKKTLKSIHKYNFRSDFSNHANPQRPGYVAWFEAGLLLCSWPKNDRPSFPIVYGDEVWTGIEYHVAAHLTSKGFLEEGLEIVSACRNRHDGIIRNPYNEYECGSWYARAMASYSLLQAYTGIRYDAVEKTLYLRENNSKKFRSFLSTATGYGTVDVDEGNVSVNVVSGKIDVQKICVEA